MSKLEIIGTGVTMLAVGLIYYRLDMHLKSIQQSRIDDIKRECSGKGVFCTGVLKDVLPSDVTYNKWKPDNKK